MNFPFITPYLKIYSKVATVRRSGEPHIPYCTVQLRIRRRNSYDGDASTDIPTPTRTLSLSLSSQSRFLIKDRSPNRRPASIWYFPNNAPTMSSTYTYMYAGWEVRFRSNTNRSDGRRIDFILTSSFKLLINRTQEVLPSCPGRRRLDELFERGKFPSGRPV